MELKKVQVQLNVVLVHVIKEDCESLIQKKIHVLFSPQLQMVFLTCDRHVEFHAQVRIIVKNKFLSVN